MNKTVNGSTACNQFSLASGFAGVHVHFIGIGGISMSALALLLLSRGAVISGSDLAANEQTDDLVRKSAVIHIGHSARNLTDPDVVIINGAISDSNPEYRAAMARKIPIIGREELLAFIERGYQQRVAIAGTHGKSTTTAMISAVLRGAEKNPTVHNGAVMKDVGSNLVLGGSDIYVTEACEFKRSFLKLNPTVAVVTNVDADHMDCYRDLNDIKNAFLQFVSAADTAIINGDCSNSTELCAARRTIRFGSSDSCDIRAVNIREISAGRFCFDAVINTGAFDNSDKPCNYPNGKSDIVISNLILNVVGFHNIFNALAAIAVALQFHVNPEIIRSALASFKGIERRFEEVGKIGECSLIVDYAHHPTEIESTIRTASSLFKRYLIVFQPHTYTRTIAFFDDFIKVLSNCDCVLFHTYAARELPIQGGTARNLAVALNQRGRKCKYFASADVLCRYLNKIASRYDAIILTGAGNINKVFEKSAET